MEVSDEDIRKFTKLVFKKAYGFGVFFTDAVDADKAYNLFLRDTKENYEQGKVKDMIERIDT
jgi:hypothetical protein